MALKKALIVDDLPNWLKRWSDYLKLCCGCEQVDTASSVEDVINLVKVDNLYDFYLVDSLRTSPEEEAGWKPVAEYIMGVHPGATIVINTVYPDDTLKEEVAQLGLSIFKKGSSEQMSYLKEL